MDDFQEDNSPVNTFAEDFEALLVEEEKLAAVKLEDWLVPWTVVRAADGLWAVLAPGKSLKGGDPPAAAFAERRYAELCAVIIPASEREPRYTLGDIPMEQGYPIFDLKENKEVIGWLREHDLDYVRTLNLVDAIQSSPTAIAIVLAHVGGSALEQTGEFSLAEVLDLERKLREE
jgi:hypothetical protein